VIPRDCGVMGPTRVSHSRDDFLKRFHLGGFVHPEPLKIDRQRANQRSFVTVPLGQRLGIVLDHVINCRLNVTNSSCSS
jgi:hypothetical protein